MAKFTDLLVKTGSPADLDKILNGWSAALIQNNDKTYTVEDGCYIARCFGDAQFIKFACEQQGYCKVVGVRPADRANEER